MGRQINFYFDENDEKMLLKILLAKDIQFLRCNVKGPKNEIYKEFHINPGIKLSIAQTYICFESDLTEVRYREVEKHAFYYIDCICSPVIEFDRSGVNTDLNTVISGRLWYEHKYWDKDKNGEDILVAKSKELEKLYNSLARWIRKYCTRLPNGNYIGPHAMELYKKGTKLSQ